MWIETNRPAPSWRAMAARWSSDKIAVVSRVSATRTRPRSASTSRSSRAKIERQVLLLDWPETPGAPGSRRHGRRSMRTIGRPRRLASVTRTSPTASRRVTVRPPCRASLTTAGQPTGRALPDRRGGRARAGDRARPRKSRAASPSCRVIERPDTCITPTMVHAHIAVAALSQRPATYSHAKDSRSRLVAAASAGANRTSALRPVPRRIAAAPPWSRRSRLTLHDTTGRLPPALQERLGAFPARCPGWLQAADAHFHHAKPAGDASPAWPAKFARRRAHDGRPARPENFQCPCAC